ncbi:metal ABC transporter permease [Peribacillus sp. AS_2]|uniref:metal ABC transporter permease n=1 Tax=Peribacillus sp. AS_2 TaxID=2996755 RepID=UPI0035BC2EE6
MLCVKVIADGFDKQQIDFDLEHVLYGEIAYTPWNTMTIGGIEAGPKAVWIVGSCFILNLILIFLFFKQFKLVSFDPALAAAMGIPVLFFHYLLMSLISLTTVASFDSVGSILVVGMLIIPAATAYLLSDRSKPHDIGQYRGRGAKFRHRLLFSHHFGCLDIRLHGRVGRHIIRIGLSLLPRQWIGQPIAETEKIKGITRIAPMPAGFM